MVLALGIGVQDFPEGAAISIPLRAQGASALKAFAVGSLSAAVEPLFAVAGALLTAGVTPIMPYALSFAAGAMIFVVTRDMIPESQSGRGADKSVICAMIGFAIMMALDVGLS
jgi:ZIP family zinc transporter